MDPSMSVTSDPHHQPQFSPFPTFTNSNPFTAPNHPFFTRAVNPSTVAPPNNNHLFQAPPQSQSPPTPPRTAFSHPPYSDMICTAIAALNEPDGSSKQAISSYIKRIYSGIPTAHGALLTHHLKTLKNSGVLIMVKKSYKLATSAPPTSVASAGLETPRSNIIVNENQPSMTSSTPPTQKRGRGRPPKAKPDLQPQTNGKPTWEQTELPIPQSEEIQPQSQQLIKRPPGRPRNDGALPTPKPSISVSVEIVKQRGRSPSGRAAGRERKPTVVSAPACVFPYVGNGSVRRRGRPTRVKATVSSVAPPPLNAGSGAEGIVKRGRGRPPKIGGVIRKAMKPKRRFTRSGRPVGRPRKNAVSMGASGRQNGDYEELRKKFGLFQAITKDIVVVLKAEIGGTENQAVVQAIKDLEGLTGTSTETTNEPQHMEEVQLADEEHPETEPEPEGQGQAQTEAEAMQESLF